MFRGTLENHGSQASSLKWVAGFQPAGPLAIQARSPDASSGWKPDFLRGSQASSLPAPCLGPLSDNFLTLLTNFLQLSGWRHKRREVKFLE